MRIAISKDGRQKLILNGTNIAMEAPSNGDPLMIEAEFDDDSPIRIIVDGSKHSVPVRTMRLVNRKVYRVAAFRRETKAGIVDVAAHDRRMPVKKLRANHKSI